MLAVPAFGSTHTDASLLDTRSAREWRTPARAAAVSPALLRGLLLTGCALAVGIAVSLGAPAAYLRADRELAFLLRGMAVIKVCLVLVAVGVLWWRFGQPLGRGRAAAYLAGACLCAAASGLIWQLTWIVPAALAFHVGGFMLLVVAYVDRDAVRQITPSGQTRPVNGRAGETTEAFAVQA